MTTTREEWIQGLRDLADFLETTEAPLPTSLHFNAFVHSREELAQAAKQIGGRLEKSFSGDWAFLRRSFGPVSYDLNVERAKVCRRVVTGTKEVPERVIPAEVIPAHTEEITEWQCDEPILESR